MISEELIDIATRHQVYLERLKAGQLRATDPLFQRLNADLLDVLGRLKDQNIGVLSLVEIAALTDDIRNRQIEAYTEHLTALTLMLRTLSDDERQFELDSINDVLEERLSVSTDQSAAAVWAFVQQRAMSGSGKLLAAWLGAWMTNEVTRSADMVRRAHSDGWNISQLLTAFRGTKAGGYRDGLFGSARRNTATTINTAIQHVSASSRMRTMEGAKIGPRGTGAGVKTDSEGKVTSVSAMAAAAGIRVGDKVTLMGYRWVSILDSVTSQICRSLDGQVFAFNKGPLPPAHPNCRSSIVAEILGRWLRRDSKGRFTRRDERSATGANGVEKVDGKVTFYEWLKTQPEAFQNDALGVTRATLFRKGGLSAAAFARLNLDRNFQPMTLDEMRAAKPNVFRRAGV